MEWNKVEWENMVKIWKENRGWKDGDDFMVKGSFIWNFVLDICEGEKDKEKILDVIEGFVRNR
jgi:hypothetical protein